MVMLPVPLGEKALPPTIPIRPQGTGSGTCLNTLLLAVGLVLVVNKFQQKLPLMLLEFVLSPLKRI